LQLGAELGADMVVIAEAVVYTERRNQHGAYDLTVNTKYLGVYTRKDKDIKCRKRGGGEWVEIGGNVGTGYLPPQWDQHRVGNTMRGMMNEMDTVLGDFNCCGGSQKRTLEELVRNLDFEDIGTTQHTHEWGQHKCKIDRVLTKSGGRPWVIKEGWGFLSDHAAIGRSEGEAEEPGVRESDANGLAEGAGVRGKGEEEEREEGGHLRA